MTVGRPSSYDREDTGPTFAAGEMSWGMNSDWSLFGGSLLTQDYTAVAGGIGRNLHEFGVVSVDVTHTNAEVPERGELRGSSLRLNYAKRFDEYDSELNFAGYRFSQRQFMTMDDFLNARNNDGVQRNSKTAYTLLASKSFRDLGFSTHVSYTHENYWDQSSSENVSAYLSRYFDVGRFKGLSMTLSLNRTRNNWESDNSLSLSLTLPFGDGQRIGYDAYASRGGVRHGASYSKYTPDHNYQIRGTTGLDGDGIQGYYSQHTAQADYSLNGSYRENGSQSVGLSVRGGYRHGQRRGLAPTCAQRRHADHARH